MKLSKLSSLLFLTLSLLSYQTFADTYSNDSAATATVTNTPSATAPLSQATDTMQATSPAVNDAQIIANIHTKIAADKTVSKSNVMTTSQNGVVKLIGNVDTDTEASKIIEIANSTPGVQSTDESQLTVKKSQQPMADTAITAKVKGSFVREKLFGDQDVSPMSISVETKDGVVYLTGTTDTQEKAANAVKIAESISGVKRVESKVEVKKS